MSEATRRRACRAVLAMLVPLCSLLGAVPVSAQNHPVLDPKGFQQNRDYFSGAPFENIDTLSGALVLTFTDLVLPGNGGWDVRFQRTYNSKSGRWTFGPADIPLYVSDPPYPTGVTPESQEKPPRS